MSILGFDRITRFFSARRTPAPAPSGNVVREATPEAAAGQKVEYLFLQSFRAGSIAPKEGEDGTYTLTLEHGLGQTIYFGDRPNRDVGTVPTPQFLEGLGFSLENPPNAALVVDTGDGETDIAVLSLANPVVDTDGAGVTYDATILADYQRSREADLAERSTDLANFPSSFGNAHLFIDDCLDGYVTCKRRDSTTQLGYFGPMGYCWNYSICVPCEPYYHNQPYYGAWADYWNKRCNEALPECQGICGASFRDYPCPSNAPQLCGRHLD